MKFSHYFIAAAAVYLLPALAAPVVVESPGTRAVDLAMEVEERALQPVGSIARYQANSNAGAVAVQIDQQTALGLGNLGLQFHKREAEPDDVQAVLVLGNLGFQPHKRDVQEGFFRRIHLNQGGSTPPTGGTWPAPAGN